MAQKQIREAAKRNDMASAKVLAKELVHTRRVTTRLWTNKAHMMSMNSQLTEQLGMVKVAGTLSKSTQVNWQINFAQLHHVFATCWPCTHFAWRQHAPLRG